MSAHAPTQRDTMCETGINSEEIETLPPSAKLVAKVLEREGELTQSDLVDETWLSRRTVRSAVARLVEDGLVETRRGPTDARTRLYRLRDSARNEQERGRDE